MRNSSLAPAAGRVHEQHVEPSPSSAWPGTPRRRPVNQAFFTPFSGVLDGVLHCLGVQLHAQHLAGAVLGRHQADGADAAVGVQHLLLAGEPANSMALL